MNKRSYTVRHSTEFIYNQPIRENVLVLNMMPLQDNHQRLDWYDLKLTPKAEIFQFKDQYGNTKQIFNILRDHQNLKICSSFQTTVTAPETPPVNSSDTGWENLKEVEQSGQMWPWFQSGYFTRVSDPLKKFLLEEEIKKHSGPLISLKRLNAKLFSVFTYKPGSTNVHSAIDEILTSRQGVCQDYVHVMITIARFWGIASRYVSGYMYQDKADEKTNTTGVSHAWCECYLPTLGWLGFDPTNNRMVGIQHIKTAVGRDYAEVPLHKGFFKGGKTEKLNVRVSIKRAY